MPDFRCATTADIDIILPMMREFYFFENLPYEESRQRRLLQQVLEDPTLGQVIIVHEGADLLGYFVLGFGFSIEFGGRDAILDELYIAPEFRGLGTGTRAVEYALEVCRQAGMEAIHLEADHFNTRAHDLYLRLGFKDHERHLMTKWLK